MIKNVIITHEENKIITFVLYESKKLNVYDLYNFINYLFTSKIDDIYDKKIKIFNHYISVFKSNGYIYMYYDLLYDYQFGNHYSINYCYFKLVVVEFLKLFEFKNSINDNLYFKIL